MKRLGSALTTLAALLSLFAACGGSVVVDGTSAGGASGAGGTTSSATDPCTRLVQCVQQYCATLSGAELATCQQEMGSVSSSVSSMTASECTSFIAQLSAVSFTCP